jgi:TPR repeat protein
MHLKIHIPNFRIVLLICLMVLSLSTRADYFDGVAAYDSGDFKTAFAEFEKSAGQGDANAQSILGMMYTNAQGVPQNYKKAIKWYRLAADQGDATAQYSLGVFYANGRGVLQDYKESVFQKVQRNECPNGWV